MSCTDCTSSQIEYAGDGVQTLFTFPFTYIEQSDVYVSFYDYEARRWVGTTEWTFANATTIEFNEAPPAPVDVEISAENIKIFRCTDISLLPAEFFPASTIRAQDLNNNFDALQLSTQEAKCDVERLKEETWNKGTYDPEHPGGDTIYSTDPWECTDEAIATTQAICDHVDAEIAERIVTSTDVRAGLWTKGSDLDNDEQVPSTAATTERLDPFYQDDLPAAPKTWRMPGKLWFTRDDPSASRRWDQENGVWIASGLEGPMGPTGATGTYSTIVSESAPTKRIDFSPLQNGDVWFRSTSAELFIWYDDGLPDGPRGRQWVQAIGGSGTEGPPGPPSFPDAPADGFTYGRKNNDWQKIEAEKLTFDAPLVESNGRVSINLQILNPA